MTPREAFHTLFKWRDRKGEVEPCSDWEPECDRALPFRPALVGLRPEPASSLGHSATIANASDGG